jgi:hypothetical protein
MAKNLLDTDPHDIPFIFRNRDLTIPSTRELHAYLSAVVEDDITKLWFLYRRSQDYVNYGGCSTHTFPKWQDKLKRDLAKTNFEDCK